MHRIKSFGLRVGLVSAAIVAAPANALQPGEAQAGPSTRVSYAGLNLARPEGQAALSVRVRVAAERLCRSHLAGSTAEHIQRRTCSRIAVEDARPQMDRAVAQSGRTKFAGRGSITVALRP